MPESRAAASHGLPGEPERFRHLPDPISLVDTVGSQPSSPVPDPTLGRNLDQDRALFDGGG